MSKIFLAGVGGIVLSAIFATLLMVANARPLSGPENTCAFASGYGVGATACDGTSELKVSPMPPFKSDAADLARADMVDRD